MEKEWNTKENKGRHYSAGVEATVVSKKAHLGMKRC